MNSPNKVHERLFNGVNGHGLDDSYLALTLKLLAALDGVESLANPVDEIVRQLEVYDGRSLAVQHITQRLASLRDQFARNQ